MPTLDTSLFIDLLRGREEAFDMVASLENTGATLATTPVNILELYKGAYASSNVGKKLEKIQKIFEGVTIIPISNETYHTFGSVAAGLKAEGRPIGDFDELIAAITLCNDGTIVTRDRHFSRIPGLAVEDY
jgi:predicted nucleic acid-binding protein